MWQIIIRYCFSWLVGVAAVVCFSGVQAQDLSTPELLETLRQGGQVIVMRHAHSPHSAPDKSMANPDNTSLQRQLDETGRTTATEMGRAMRNLGIPITTVMSSPTYRALETVTLAKWPSPTVHEELGNAAAGMRESSAEESIWLRQQAMHLPSDGNTIIVTHSTNVLAAFPEYKRKLADGEALVFGSDGNGGINLLSRMRIEDWPKMAG